jgi:hypothetical protein
MHMSEEAALSRETMTLCQWLGALFHQALACKR